MEENKRQKQVGKLVMEELSDIFQREGMNIVDGGMVSISKVMITPDLLEARVYLSLFQVKDQSALLHKIKERTKEWRNLLGKRIKDQLRRVPELSFFADDTLEHVSKMEELFRKIKEADEAKKTPPGAILMERMLIWKLAYRYLRGKRTANAVPILSRISMVAIAVSSAAMIIIFSVFNGLELTVKDLYTSFYPDIKITTVKGKFFSMDAGRMDAIKHTKDAETVTPVIEDNVMANNGAQQIIITVKGIENSYFRVNNLRQYIVQGEDSVSTGGNGRPYTAIAGLHILNELGADLNALSYIVLYYPNPDIKDPTADPLSAFQSLRLHPSGVFHMEQDFDAKYMLAPLSLVQELFHAPGKYSSIEISAQPGAEDRVKKQIEHIVGPSFRVETRYEQNRTLYVVMGAEKWAVCAILVLVLLIASFNMLGALSMLVLEKQKDIAILKAMGAHTGTIRKVFLLEGILWSLMGGAAGLIIGCTTCLLQQKFGFVKLGGDFLVDAYPVKLQFTDILLVLAAILSVGLLISWYPAMRATKAVDPTLKSA